MIFTNEDDDDGSAGGVYGSFALWGDLGGLVVGIDGYADQLFLDDDQEDDVPGGVVVLGGHVGGNLGDVYLGGFGAVGWAPDSGIDEYAPGYLVGVEGSVALDGGVTLFGQLGYADIRLGNGNNEGFTGTFIEGGALFALSDDFAILAKAGFGYAPEDYTDSGEEDGSYATVGAKLAYKLPVDFGLVLTASYDYTLFNAIDDGDTADAHTFKVGLSIPFGDNTTAATALNPLATPVTPFRAATYGDLLD